MIQLETRVKENYSDAMTGHWMEQIAGLTTHAGKMLHPGPRFSKNVHKASRFEYLQTRTIHSSAPAKDQLFGRTPNFRSILS